MSKQIMNKSIIFKVSFVGATTGRPYRVEMFNFSRFVNKNLTHSKTLNVISKAIDLFYILQYNNIL